MVTLLKTVTTMKSSCTYMSSFKNNGAHGLEIVTDQTFPSTSSHPLGLHWFLNIFESKLNHQWFRWWIIACWAPIHYLSNADTMPLCLNFNVIVMEIQTFSFCAENALENAACKMSTILYRSLCVEKTIAAFTRGGGCGSSSSGGSMGSCCRSRRASGCGCRICACIWKISVDVYCMEADFDYICHSFFSV